MNRAATPWIMAGLIALLLGAAWQLDEAPAPAPELTRAQQHARDAARLERAAEQLCIRTHGPRAQHGWDADGHLVCTTRRAAAVAMGERV